MTDRPLTLLHTSDLHLERTLGGAARVPPAALEMMADAPLLAAERLFDVAMEQRPDALLLVGDVIDARRAGPAEIEFLATQLQRLADSSVPVIWAAGGAERRGSWPNEIPLPENVIRIGQGTAQTHVLQRDGQAIAEVISVKPDQRRSLQASGSRQLPSDLPRVAMAWGKFTRRTLWRWPVTYWALGGRHDRRCLNRPGPAGASKTGSIRPAAWYCGAPQGFLPRNVGAHGILKVQIDPERRVTVETVPTEVARWCWLELDATDATSREELLRRMLTQLEQQSAQLPDVPALVCWRIRSAGRLGYELRRGDSVGWLLGQLRKQLDGLHQIPLKIEIDAPVPSPQMLEDESLLGEFLRVLQQYTQGDAVELEWPAAIHKHRDARLIMKLMDRKSPSYRARVLQAATALGMDLLQPAPAHETSTEAGKNPAAAN